MQSRNRTPSWSFPSSPRKQEPSNFSHLPPCSSQGQALGARTCGDDEFARPVDIPNSLPCREDEQGDALPKHRKSSED